MCNVYTKVKSLKPSNTEDVYGFSYNFVKDIVDVLDLFTFLVDFRFIQGYFPGSLKITKIALLQKGDITLHSSYQTI